MSAVADLIAAVFLIAVMSAIEDHRPRKQTTEQAKLSSRRVVEIMQGKEGCRHG